MTTTTASSDTNMLQKPSQGQKQTGRALSNAPAPASADPDRIQTLNRANNGGRPTIQGSSHPRALTGTRQSMPSNRTTTYSNGFHNVAPSNIMGAQIHVSHMSAGPQTSGQLETYHIGRVVGQGAYAAVRLCLDKRNQKKYAMKIYEKYRLQDPMKRKAAQREITVLKRLQHPGIIKLHDLIDTPKQIYIVTDFVKGISLQQYSKSLTNRIIRETTARRIFKQVAESVVYLHSINTVHRDIKLDNILIEEGTRMVKLIDFGFSVIVANH